MVLFAWEEWSKLDSPMPGSSGWKVEAVAAPAHYLRAQRQCTECVGYVVPFIMSRVCYQAYPANPSKFSLKAESLCIYFSLFVASNFISPLKHKKKKKANLEITAK